MNSPSESIPALILGYGRLENIENQIGTLVKSSDRRIYVHLDQGKTKELQARQTNFINLIRKQLGSRVRILHRERNLGVGVGVISAIDWFFTYEEVGIVIEDDLVFEEFGIHFLEIGIKYISGMESALMVAGSTFSQNKLLASKRQCSWTNIPLIWGWGTTKPKWQEMRKLITNCQIPNIRDFFSPALSFFQSGRIKALSQKIDTWDLPLAYMMYKGGRLCLVPPENYFSNIGNDEFASHTKDDSFPMHMPISSAVPEMSWFCLPNKEKIKAQNQHYFRELYKVKFRNIIGLVFSIYLTPKIGTLRNRLNQ